MVVWKEYIATNNASQVAQLVSIQPLHQAWIWDCYLSSSCFSTYLMYEIRQIYPLVTGLRIF